MDKELRAIEFEALANEAQVVCIEVQGMKYENEARMYLGRGVEYHEDSFEIKASEIKKIVRKMRELARK